MKKLICALMLSASGAFAQQPGVAAGNTPFPPANPAATSSTSFPRGTSSMTFDVRAVANGGGQDPTGPKTGRTGLPVNTRVRESQTTLELRARNLSANPLKAQFQWFFVAQVVNGGRKYISDRGDREIALEGGAETKETMESKEIVQVTTTTSTRSLVTTSSGSSYYSTQSLQTKGGSRPVGWIMRMFADGKLVRVQASSSEMEKMGYDPNFEHGQWSRPGPGTATR